MRGCVEGCAGGRLSQEVEARGENERSVSVVRSR